MRRSPLKRKTALKRGKPMRRKVPRRVRRSGDPEYMEKVRRLPCCAPRSVIVFAYEPRKGFIDPGTARSDVEHSGRIHAHHAGRRPGTGMKAHDDTCIALCEKHHRQWHDGTGVFAQWDKIDRRMWADAAIADTQRLIRGETSGKGTEHHEE